MPQAATAAAMPAPAMPAPAMPAAGLPGATMSTMATSRHMGHPMQPTLPSSSPGAHPAGTPVHFVQMPGQMSDQMGMLPGGSGGVAGIATRPIAFSPQAMFPAALPMGVGTSAHFMSMDPLQHGAIPGAMLASATAGDPNADARLLAGQRPVKRLSNGRTGKRNLNKDVVKVMPAPTRKPCMCFGSRVLVRVWLTPGGPFAGGRCSKTGSRRIKSGRTPPTSSSSTWRGARTWTPKW
mgnify:CR=1 FL=1|jgi:hypothetical protein